VAGSPLNHRITQVVGSLSLRTLSDRLGIHEERVRRYLNGAAPSLEFVEAVCRAFGVSRQWLVTGRGPRHSLTDEADVLNEAEAGELLEAVSDALESLLERVDRLESFASALESRLRQALGEVRPAGAASAGRGTKSRQFGSRRATRSRAKPKRRRAKRRRRRDR